jgi:hypothetical protein
LNFEGTIKKYFKGIKYTRYRGEKCHLKHNKIDVTMKTAFKITLALN